MANNGKAPVCPISRSQAVPGQPGRQLPPIPRAVDLPSLVQAVNTINHLLMIIAGPGPVTNNFFVLPPFPFGNNNSAQQHGGGSLEVRSNWQEIGRADDLGWVWYNKGSGKYDKKIRLKVVRIYGEEFSPSGSTMEMSMRWWWEEQKFDQGPLHDSAHPIGKESPPE